MTMQHNLNTELHFFFNMAGSCQMEGITDLYNYITGYLAGILCFVSALLAFVIYFHTDGRRHLNQFVEETKEEFINWIRFVKNWTHSTSLELVWTIIPTCILIAIAVPSFILLYALDEIVDCQCVVKIVGYQWYWRYEYPVSYHEDFDVINVSVLSYMKPLEDLTAYMPLRLLEVDMPLVLPHSVNVKLIITSKDVLHSFAVPSLGIKMDAVPGRLNQVTLFIIQPGVYYGQCSELCGVNHAYMPIVIHAISFELYEEFLMKIVFAQEKEKIQKALDSVLNDEEFMNSLLVNESSDNQASKSGNISDMLNKCIKCIPCGDGASSEPKKSKFSNENLLIDCSMRPEGMSVAEFIFDLLYPVFPEEGEYFFEIEDPLFKEQMLSEFESNSKGDIFSLEGLSSELLEDYAYFFYETDVLYALPIVDFTVEGINKAINTLY